jgi:tetratricopeptide (TPR) repeat protein
MRRAVGENNLYDAVLAGLAAGYLHDYMRNFEYAEAVLVPALELSEKHQFSQFAAAAQCCLGHVRARLGRAAEGVALINKGLKGFAEVGTRLGLTREETNLGDAQGLSGVLGDALETIEEALALNPEELAYRSETLRIRGALRLNQGHIELAEADFYEGIALARSMSAKAWELRAIMSLARLLCDTSRRDEARMMLSDIYNWFTEGFDTADLIDAKALLDGLPG